MLMVADVSIAMNIGGGVYGERCMQGGWIRLPIDGCNQNKLGRSGRCCLGAFVLPKPGDATNKNDIPNTDWRCFSSTSNKKKKNLWEKERRKYSGSALKMKQNIKKMNVFLYNIDSLSAKSFVIVLIIKVNK